MINVISELAFINDIVDLFAHTGNAAFRVHLALDMGIVPGSTEWQVALNGDRAVGDDILKVERT